jgi:hypothetical protein
MVVVVPASPLSVCLRDFEENMKLQNYVGEKLAIAPGILLAPGMAAWGPHRGFVPQAQAA